MKFDPNQIRLFTKAKARKAAQEAISRLTDEDASRMFSELRLSPGAVKHLNRRMCERIIEWTQKNSHCGNRTE